MTTVSVGALATAQQTATAELASPASHITFVGPTVRPLPTDLEFLSPDSHLTIGLMNCYTGSFPGPIELCQPHLVAREGPDPDGLYHFRFGLPTAAAGEVHIEARSSTPDPLDGDRLVVVLTATTSGISFGDVQTCLMPGTRPRADGNIAFELGYYSQTNSTAVVFQQERLGRRWASPKLKALANYPVGGRNGFTPYLRRMLRLRVSGEDLAMGEVRLRYFVMKGNHPMLAPRQRARVLKMAKTFSNTACLPPGGI
jgi:hypothetical protein